MEADVAKTIQNYIDQLNDKKIREAVEREATFNTAKMD